MPTKPLTPAEREAIRHNATMLDASLPKHPAIEAIMRLLDENDALRSVLRAITAHWDGYGGRDSEWDDRHGAALLKRAREVLGDE